MRHNNIIISVVTNLFSEISKGMYRLLVKRKTLKKKGSYGYIHFSIDDVINIFKDLTLCKEKYKSIFENAELKYLKTLHENYGIKVCLYCFFEDEEGFDLSMVPDLFKAEFEANSNWLKVGFHGRNNKVLYSITTMEYAKDDYQKTVKELIRICGENSISQVVRLSSFQGNRESILAMKECYKGINGLLTADDERKSYYIDGPYDNSTVSIIDGIRFYHTDIRIENRTMSVKKVFAHQKRYIIFTHEYFLKNRRIQSLMEKIFYDSNRIGLEFTFLE